MNKKLYMDSAAEREADEIGRKFMNSSDVVGDMSRAYGTDLSSVKIHTDDNAAYQASQRGVDAFSTGKDVFFARGAFDRSDPASRGLLAHELSHSLQQGVGGAGSMVHSVPMGAEQGGILDWFRARSQRKARQEKQQRLYDAVNGQNLSDKVRNMRNLSITNTRLSGDMDVDEKGAYIALIREISELPEDEKRAFVDEMFRQQLSHAAAVNEIGGSYEDESEGRYRAGHSDDAAMMQGYSSLLTDFNLMGVDDSGEFFMEAYGEKLNSLRENDRENYQVLRAAQASAGDVGDRNAWANANPEEAAQVKEVSRRRMVMFSNNWKRPEPQRRKHHFRRWLNK